MASRRYTIILADRTTGVVRRATVSIRPFAIGACVLASLPILVGIGAAWKAKSDVVNLVASHQALEIENNSYRQATEALSGQIASLQATVSDLGAKSALDPKLAQSVDRLPAFVKARAMGGSTEVQKSAQNALASLSNPEDTFGLLRTILQTIESRLDVVSTTVERRNALVNATPSMWPTHGWLTSAMGMRTDPVNGGNNFHSGLDIAGDKGQLVFATAAGKVTFTGFSGDYGNLIVIDHGFGLQTRYGHLSAYKVKVGDQVKRGGQIGNVGATGRATGYHLHYEVLANGKLLNPLQLLTQNPGAR